jgi:hypothetical protein
VLEARAAPEAALHYAKLQKAANETQADCLAMIKRAEIRMADEIDAAQARGDVARPTDSLRQNTVARNSGNGAVTYDELGVTSQRVAEWRDAGEGTVDQAMQAALDENRAPTNADIQRALRERHHRTQFTGETEWYTPAEYVEAARACLGGIDLDPATSPLAQDTIKAARFFTCDDDGLRHDWRVDASAIFHEGERFPPRGYEPADLESIKRELAAWSEWAARHPATILPRPDRP